MNNLRDAIKQLDTLAESYNRRWFANGPGHSDNAYLRDQAERFWLAASTLRQAVAAASARIEDVTA